MIARRWYENAVAEGRAVLFFRSLKCDSIQAETEMKEAILYDRLSDGRVKCRVCSHCCTIARGQRGICAVRENVDGQLMTLVYGRVIARDVDPIEKKPLFHFYPGTRSYSIATVGCNFTCLNCQNAYISQYPRDHGGRIVGDSVLPEEIVADAVTTGCHSIAYTYSEPTIAIEFVLDVMHLAKEEGLANVWVSNGYFTAETAEQIGPFLDAINIDLKGISDEVYHEIAGGNLRPVLDTIERLHRAGVWVEVTTLVIPGINDSESELRWTAEAIRGISPQIPWHVSRFFPAYRLVDRPPTPVETLKSARRIGREVGLRYVYLGNLPGEGEETRCPECGEHVITRSAYLVRENRLRDGVCPECGASVDGVFFSVE
jgi:pyruvate formate lyase activating enzyme